MSTPSDTDTITYAELVRSLKRLGYSILDATSVFERAAKFRQQDKQEQELKDITGSDVRAAILAARGTTYDYGYRDTRTGDQLADDVLTALASARTPADPAPALVPGVIVKSKRSGNYYRRTNADGWQPVTFSGGNYPDHSVGDIEVIAVPPAAPGNIA